jgi:signal transduction histidine kinase/ligand-binding sensor domain-containing protein
VNLFNSAKTTTIIILLIIFCSSAIPQTTQLRESEYLYQAVHKYEFEHLTVDDGLSHNSIISILQDNDGFLWFATWGGLNRYDGYKFTYFQSNSEDSTSVSHNAISVFFEDNKDILWAGTVGGGLNRFNKDKLNFQTFTNPLDTSNSNLNHRINKIIQDTTGLLWVPTFEGIDVFDPQTNTYVDFIRYITVNNNRFSVDYVDNVLVTKKGELLFGTISNGGNTFIVIYDREKADHQLISIPVRGSSTSIIEDRNGDLWIGSDFDGLIYYNRKTRQVKKYRHNPNDDNSLGYDIIECLYEDRNGHIWVGTRGNGISILNRQKNTFSHIRHSAINPRSLSNNFIYSLYEDNSGILWIGTGGGVNKLNLERKKFVKLINVPGDENKKLDQAWHIEADNRGNLWIAAFGRGVIKYHPLMGEYKIFENNYNDPNSIPTNHIRFIFIDKFDEIWLGTDQWGVIRINEKTGKLKIYRNESGSPTEVLNNNSVNSIYEDKKGNMWIGTWLGLTKWNSGFRRSNNFKFTHYLPDENDSTAISYEVVNQVYEDRSGTIWIATKGGGINKIVKKEGRDTFVSYKFDPDDSSSISHNEVFFIYEDRAGRIWVGTNGGGLNKFNREENTFKHYKVEGESALNIHLSVLEDQDGNLWIGSKGLLKFNPLTETFTHYDEKQGLINDLYSIGAASLLKSGDMVFGGGGGLNIFDPAKIYNNPYKPRKTVVTDFQLFNESVPVGNTKNNRVILDKSITELDSLILNYKQDVLTFEFSALHFSNPAKNKYRYQMEGFDKSWISTDASRRYVTYTNLNPGAYVFKVTGSNNDGLWTDNPVNLKIIIEPPYWSTWWFRFIVVFLVTYGVIYIYQTQTRLIKARNIKLMHEVKVRQKAENDLHQRLNFENIISKISAKFVSVSGDVLDVEIDKALKKLGQFIECEGAFINLFGPGQQLGNIEYAWNFHFRQKMIFKNSKTTSKLNEYFISELSANKPVVLNSLKDLPGHLKLEEKILKETGIRSILIAPMVANNKLIGLLGFDNLKHNSRWSASEINLIELSASIFANAIERQNTMNLLVSSEDKLRSLTLYLQKIREEDRLSIAREMHDELGQILTAIKMDVIMMETSVRKNKNLKPALLFEETAHIKTMIDSTIKNVRKLITDLRPEVLDNLGLLEAIQWYIEEYEKRTGIKIKYKANVSHIEFNKDFNIAIYRIIQESFTNISRHAKAKNIIVDINKNNKILTFIIKDDGIGFDLYNTENQNHFGILGMRERVHIFNGYLDIKSKPGSGTTVIMEVPLN